MRYDYKLGKAKNWTESAVVGTIGLGLCIIGAGLSSLLPILLGILGVVLFVAGVTGFLKRVEK